MLSVKRGLYTWLYKPLFSILIAIYGVEAYASETVKAGQSVTQPSDYFGQIMLSLVLVLLIIFFSAWLLRRYGRAPGVANGSLKVVGALSVGQRERIMLLQVGKEQILVGVTTSKISTLHRLQEPVETTAKPEAVKGAFAQRLQEALSKNSQRGTASQDKDVSQSPSENP